MIPILALAFLLLASNADAGSVWSCFAQTCQALDARVGDSFDAGTADATTACKTGTSAPASCEVGECFFDTDETAGQNLFGCTSTNTWTLLGDGGGGGGGCITTCGGSSTEVGFWNTGSDLQGDAELRYNSTADRLLIGAGDYGWGGLSLYDDTASQMGVVSAYVGADSTSGGFFVLAKAAGTIGGEAAVPDNDLVGRIWFIGHNGTSYVNSCQMNVYADGVFSGANQGSDWELTCPVSGATSMTQRILVDGQGKTTMTNSDELEIDSTLDVDPNKPDCTSGTVCEGSLVLNPTWAVNTTGSNGTLIDIGGSLTPDGTATTYSFLRSDVDVQLGSSATTLSFGYVLLETSEFLAGANTPVLSEYGVFYSKSTFKSDTAGRAISGGTIYKDRAIQEYSATSGTSTSGSSIGYDSTLWCWTSDTTTGSPTVNCNKTHFYAGYALLDADHANNTTNAVRKGYHYVGGYVAGNGVFGDTSPGTEELTEEWGVYLANPSFSHATVSHGFLNELSTEFALDEQILAASTTIDPKADTAFDLCIGTCVDTAGNITWTGTGSEVISDGNDGQVLFLVNADSSDSITITDGNNINLPNGNHTLAPSEGLTVMWSDEADTWVALVIDTGSGGGGSTVTTDQATISGGGDACSTATIPETTLTTVATLADYDNTGNSSLITGTACFTFGATRTITLTMELEGSTVATSTTTMTSGESTCMTVMYLDTTSASARTITIRAQGSAGSGSPTHNVDGCFITRITHD